jgi:hypothetical protein
MSAERALQAAVLQAMRGNAVLAAGSNDVFEGPAVRASTPFVELGELLSVDWSVKDRTGREVRLSITVRDAGDTPARLNALVDAASVAIEALPRDLPGWRIAGVMFVRRRSLRGPPGSWAATIDYRVRMMEVL